MTLEEQIAWIGSIQYWFQDKPEASNLTHIKDSLRKLQKLEDISRQRKEQKVDVYADFIGAYDEFCKSFIGVGAKIDGAQGKAMKTIIKYLVQESKEGTTEGALNAWKYILSNWNRLSAFIRQQTALVQINKNLQEILTQLRHGHGKATGQTTANSIKQRVMRRQQSGDNPDA